MDASHLDLFAVLDSLADGVALADMDGRIFFSNATANQLLGVPKAESVPETWADHYGVFLPDGETPFPTEQFALVRALRGEESSHTEMVIKNTGNPRGRLIRTSGRPLVDADGKQVGAAVVMRDITNERAVQKMREELAALIVHDLKSPLTSIVCAADMLLLGDLPDEGDRFAAMGIRDASQRLHRMVLDLLDIHLSEDAALDAVKAPTDVRALLQEVWNAMLPSVGAAGQQLQPLTAPEGVVVNLDGNLIRRVMQNLVDNCVKYAGHGGQIWIDAAPAGAGRVHLRVCDDGPGVPVELRTKIFEKYSSVERDEKGRHMGSRGLGLRFCDVAVKAHGGRIWVEDNQPQGAAFCVELPA
jgi:signal transduction histidine kinase